MAISYAHNILGNNLNEEDYSTLILQFLNSATTYIFLISADF